MAEPLDELYLRWLYGQVGNVKLRDRRRTYWSLMRLLYKKEFVWLIPNDDNRLAEGLDLRMDFIHEEELIDVDPMWLELGCSMLEMLIALSRRLNFQRDELTVGEWFWELIENLRMKRVDRDFTPNYEDYFNDSLDIVIWRTYKASGFGGLFPLTRPKKDQRDVELWYQLSAYLLETK